MKPNRAPRIASTLDFRGHPPFRERVEPLRPSGEPATLRTQLRLLRRILSAAAAGRPLILYSSRGSLKPDLLACLIMATWPRSRRPPTVLVGEMWQPESGWRAFPERQVVRLADRAIDRYLVLSEAEAQLLPRTWPIDGRKTRVCRFYFSPEEHGITTVAPTRGDYVFAGGDSFRDYTPLLEAARRLPDVPFLIVTKAVPEQPPPENVVVRSVPYQQYVSLMRDADLVVVPVQTGLRRSAGILTFIMSMYLGKPTVVSAALAADEYIEHERSGLIVDGTPESYVDAICRLRNEPETAAQLAAAARRKVEEEFTFTSYVDTILREIDQVTAQSRLCQRR